MRVLERFKKNKRGRKGFTLAETLIAVLILLMVSSIMATGIPAASNAYRKVVVAANADTLLSTAISELRNELGTATNVRNNGANAVVYNNSLTGSTSEIYLGIGGELFINRYANVSTSEGGPLISHDTATDKLYVVCGGIEYKDGVVTFTDVQVKQENKDTALCSTGTVSVRVI